MKILFCGYRDWALNVAHNIMSFNNRDVWVCKSPEELLIAINDFGHNDLVGICCGWSWKIPTNVLEKVPFFGIHPSKLPQYAGGTPLQHQILDGLTTSFATLFEITPKLDQGNVVDSEEFSLNGNMSDILQSLQQSSINLVDRFLKKYPNHSSISQSELGDGFVRKRLKPAESELTRDLLSKLTARELYDFIRCREEPYPNAFIKDETGKLLIKLVGFEDE
jgi:methionyl-tRNA formyltransferase